MFRLWAKIWKSGRMTRDMVVCNDNRGLNRKQANLAGQQHCRIPKTR